MVILRFGAMLAAAVPTAVTGAPAPASIREIVEITDLSSLALSPDGRFVAYRAETASVEGDTYRLDWYVVPADGRTAPLRIASAGEGDWPDGTLFSEPPIWSGDSRAIYFRAIVDADVQLWRASRDGSSTVQLTHDTANVRAFALTSDGQGLVYEIGAPRAAIERAERDEYDQGVRIDATVDPSRQLYRGSRIDGRAASERLRGGWFAHGGMLASAPPFYRQLALDTLQTAAASPDQIARIGPTTVPLGSFGDRIVLSQADSGDGRGFAAVTAEGLSGRLTVARRDNAKTTIACNRPQCMARRLVNVQWTPVGDRIVFTTSDDATNQSLHLWSIATGAVRTFARGNGQLNGGRDGLLGCAIGEDAAYCVAASANVPPRLVRVDFASGNMRTLAAPNTPLERSAGPMFVPFTWSSISGRKFNGHLMVPSGLPRAWPLFVTYYVCDGYLRGGTGDEFPLRQLPGYGIATLCINRLPTVPGPGDQIEQYRIAQDAVGSAIDALSRRNLVDRGRVGMGGVSFGGESTLWIAAHSDMLSAMSVSNSALTPTYYWFNALPGRNVAAMLQKVWGLGDPDTDLERWRRLSPALSTASIKAPLLMQLPEQEYRLNIELAARLARDGTPADTWAFPDETHIKYRPRHKLSVYRRNLDWFRYWLTGSVDSDPVKAPEFAPWLAYNRKPGWNDAVRGQGVPSQPRTQRSVSAIGNSR